MGEGLIHWLSAKFFLSAATLIGFVQRYDLIGHFGKGDIVADQEQLIIPVLGDFFLADIDGPE